MTTPNPRVFDRVPSPPSESARYPVRSILSRTVPPREVHWALPDYFPLDQGSEGACVGFGVSAELSADPVAVVTGNPYAFALYADAQAEDRAMGNNYGAGATVLAGLKAARKRGVISGYRWAQSFDDIRDAVIALGSVVMGTDWLADMDHPNDGGLIRVGGRVRGGHCWTLIGYVPNHPEWGEVFEAVNSWGDRFGVKGRFYVEAAGLRVLFERNGEAAIVTDSVQIPDPPKRKWPRIPLWFRKWLESMGIRE